MWSFSPLQILKAILFFIFFEALTIAALHFLPSNNKTILLFFSHHKVVVLFSLLWCSLVALLDYMISTRPLPILLLGYICHKPEPERRCSLEVGEYFTLKSGRFSAKSEAFMRAICVNSSIDDETYGPPFLFHAKGYDASVTGWG